jgi:HK97 family phage major capsid protein
MALSTVTGGPVLSPEAVHSLVIQPLIDQSIAAQASTVVQVSSHDLRIPRVTTDPAAAWTAEGAEINATDAVLDEITCTPKKLAGLCVISNELANDSSPAALGVVGQGLVRDLRRKLDAAWLTATTTNGPSGLPSLTTSTTSAGGAWSSFDWAEAAKSADESLHTVVTSFVTSPATALALSTVKQFSTAGSNVPLLAPDPSQPSARTIAGVPLLVSPSVAADTIWAIPRDHVLFVIRQDASVVSDGSVFFTKDSVAVRATLRVGFAYTYPLAITKISKT